MRILVDRPCCAKFFESGARLAIAELGTVGFGTPLEVEEFGLFTEAGVQLKYCPECGEEVTVTAVRQTKAEDVACLEGLDGMIAVHWGPRSAEQEIRDAGISLLTGDIGRAEVALVSDKKNWRRSKTIQAFVQMAWAAELPVYRLLPDGELRYLPANAEVFDGE